jgi:genome maintenance exonuclease 1
MFTHLNTITTVELKTIEGIKGRQYITPLGAKYPSITTVLGQQEKPHLKSWRANLGEAAADKETKRAADRGSAVHLMIERFLNNDPDPTAGQHLDHITEFNSLRLHLKKINNIITQESALWSDEMKVAGRVDCCGEFERKLSIIDFKTSTNNKSEAMIQDYWLQTTAYALMMHERYDIKIDNIVIIMSVERGAVPLIFKKQVDEFIEPLLKRINTYHTTVGVAR